MAKHFLILGTQRTGSSVLYHSLNSHPEIACGGEWTLQAMWYNKVRFAQRALGGDFTVLTPSHQRWWKPDAIRSQQTRWLGFKLLFRSSDKWLGHPRFSPALWLDRLEDHLRWLLKQPDIHIIHIVRCSAIEWLKSKYLSQATRTYTNRRYPDGSKIEIPFRGAVKRLHAKNWIDNRLAILANSNPYLRIYYEDFLQSKQVVLASVLQFLECDVDRLGKIEHSIQRQSTRPAADYLLNYDHLIGELERCDLLKASLCK